MRIIGTCSLCGGNVVMPDAWHSIYPPKPRCTNCGATKKVNLPVIPMEPPMPPSPHNPWDNSPWKLPPRETYTICWTH